MTIKELKAHLETLPEDATAFFTLWTADGAKHYWFNSSGGRKVYEGVDGKQFALIAFTDQCRAQTLYDSDDDNILRYDHELPRRKV